MMINQTIANRYRIIKQLDKGGMGTVYIGEHIDLRQKVAIKILNQDARRNEGENRFINEAKTYASINHPNLVQLHDFETTSSYMAMVLEYCPGENLYQFLKKYAPLPVPLAVDIVIQIAQGLNAAHDNRILHRDLKPANIMLVPTTKDPKRYVVKLLDFGIAKDLNNNNHLTQQGMVCGTPEYMSPEQACGEKVSNACDIYALGVVFYEMLAGHLPFRDEVRQNVMLKHCQQIPPPLKQVTPKLEQIVMRCLHKKAEDRYASTIDLIDALDMFTQDEYGYKAPIEIRTILQHKVEKLIAQRIAIKDEPPSQISMKMVSPDDIKNSLIEANQNIKNADIILEQINDDHVKAREIQLPPLHKNDQFWSPQMSLGVKHHWNDIWGEIQEKQKDPSFKHIVFIAIACLSLLLLALYINQDIKESEASEIPIAQTSRFIQNAPVPMTSKQLELPQANEPIQAVNTVVVPTIEPPVELQETAPTPTPVVEEKTTPVPAQLPLPIVEAKEPSENQLKNKYKFKSILKDCNEIDRLNGVTKEIKDLKDKCETYRKELSFIKLMGCPRLIKKYDETPDKWIAAIKKSNEFQELIHRCRALE